MFTGIIETTGQVQSIEPKGTNLRLIVKCDITAELRVDQSIAHHGVCLTVVEINGENYSVDVVKETIDRTNLKFLEPGDSLNLERCMTPESFLDGHIVQGHVDQVGECIDVHDKDGSWFFKFQYQNPQENLVVEKGSIAVDGVSLTVVEAIGDTFSVAIIPHTFQNTGLKFIQPGRKVNLEFDILGKYVARMMAQR